MVRLGPLLERRPLVSSAAAEELEERVLARHDVVRDRAELVELELEEPDATAPLEIGAERGELER
jgi:hypothetical protein